MPLRTQVVVDEGLIMTTSEDNAVQMRVLRCGQKVQNHYCRYDGTRLMDIVHPLIREIINQSSHLHNSSEATKLIQIMTMTERKLALVSNVTCIKAILVLDHLHHIQTKEE